MSDASVPYIESAVSLLRRVNPDLTPEQLTQALASLDRKDEEPADWLIAKMKVLERVPISLSTLNRMIRDRQVRCIKVRGRAFIPNSDVEALVSKGV